MPCSTIKQSHIITLSRTHMCTSIRDDPYSNNRGENVQRSALHTLPGVMSTNIFEPLHILDSKQPRGNIPVNCSIAHRVYIITFPYIACLYRAAQREEGHVRDARYSPGPRVLSSAHTFWLPVRRSSLVCDTKERVFNSRRSLNVMTRRRNNK